MGIGHDLIVEDSEELEKSIGKMGELMESVM